MQEKIEIFGVDKGGNWSKHQVDLEKIFNPFCKAKYRCKNLNPLSISYPFNRKDKKYHSKILKHIYVTLEDFKQIKQEVNLSR